MLRYIPPFILSKYEAQEVQGSLNAYALLFDIADFTVIGTALQKEGKQGAEELSHFLDMVFSVSLELVNQYGGFVSGFAGDAFCAVFPEAKPESVISAVNAISAFFEARPVYRTSFGEFALQVRQTVCYGSVDWQIFCHDLQNEYVFYGDVMQELAELSSQKTAVIWSACAASRIGLERFQPEGQGYVLQDKSIYAATGSLSYPSHSDTALLFCHPRLREITPQNEIRTAAYCFASLAQVKLSERADAVAALVSLADKYGAFFNRLDDTDKGLVALLLFGLPQSEGKTLERICSFALEAVHSRPDIAVGISCGSVFAGFNSTAQNREYTAYGHPVNLAARLMGKARAGEVLADTYLWQEMHAQYDFDYLGSLNLKASHSPSAITV